MKGMRLDTVTPIVARFLGIEPARLAKHFHPASEHHLPQVLDMRQKFVPHTLEEDEVYLRWRYDFSPSTSGQALHENHIWVLTKDETVLGFVGVESANLLVDGNTLEVAKVMDLAVKPELDGKGLGVWMNLVLQNMGRPVIALGSNKNSIGIVSKLFHRLPSQKVYKNILNGRHYFTTRSRYPLLATSVSFVYDASLFCLLLVKSAASSPKLKLQKIERFNGSHAASLGKMNHFGIQFRRDCDYLNWRLFDNPRDHVEVTGLWRGEQLVGYFALARRYQSRDKATPVQAFILDWGLLPGKKYEKILVAALWRCQRDLQRQGVESISAFSYGRCSDRLLRSAGLHHRDDDTKTVSIFAKDPDALHKMQRAERWFLTGLDTDYA